MDNTIRGISPYQGVPGARHTAASETVPTDGYLPTADKSSDEEAPKKSHRLRKVVLGSALALSAVGAAGVGATYVAGHAPICADAQTNLAITDKGLCVSEEIGMKGAHGWRILEGIPSLPGAIEGLNSNHNQVFTPSAGSQPPAPALASGQLKAITFNLHHERSPDSVGARPQTEEIVQALREQKGDVYLLQEVSPAHVDDLVNGLGMTGYYSQTTLLQGNLVLVHPDLPVTEDSSQMVLNGGGSLGEALGSLQDWATHGGGAEPRSVQTVEVELPNGREALLWNTHQPTHTYTDQQRVEAREATMEALERRSEPDQIVIGGGDLNAGDDGSLANMLRAQGHEVHAYDIDFINTKNATGPVSFQGFHLVDSQGFPLSDHPMAVAGIPV